jgi:hypothetical protein
VQEAKWFSSAKLNVFNNHIMTKNAIKTTPGTSKELTSISVELTKLKGIYESLYTQELFIDICNTFSLCYKKRELNHQ